MDRLPSAPEPTRPVRVKTHSEAIEEEHWIRIHEHHESLDLQEKKKKKVGKPCSWTLDQERKLIRLWEEGHTLDKITREMGISVNIIKHRVFNLQQEGKLRKRNKAKTLTVEQSEEIKRLRKKGLTQRQIGDIVGVSRSTVQQHLQERKQ